MAYCTAAEVKYLVHTGLDDTALGSLIDIVDVDLDDRLGSATLSDDLKKLCSMLLTAVLCADRDPESYALGEARIKYGNRIKNWEARVERIINKAKGAGMKVRATAYQHIDESSRYPL